MVTKAKHWTSRQVGLAYGFRSGLEEEVAKQLENAGINPNFETLKIPFMEYKNRTYTPDFPVTSTIIIETKGRFQTADRMKMLAVKKQYPEYEFRFVFSNANAKISKVSKTTYAQWCENNGFKWANKCIPEEWIEEIKQLCKEGK